jgi:hypothetical protein
MTHPVPARRRLVRLASLSLLGLALVGAVFSVYCYAAPDAEQAAKVDPTKNRITPEWGIHDMKRPKPPVVDPGTPSTQEQPGKPPGDAVVLFDGTDLSKWQGPGAAAQGGWKVQDGYMEVGGRGGIATKEEFGDVQLHIEWAAPNPPRGEGQDRGNSGVYLMEKYEVQVLDSFQADTYADGQASALYGQYPPLVNASRPPGQWQTYDIIFRGPRFDSSGKVLRPATVTVLHNGVLTQDHSELVGPSGHKAQPTYRKHAEKGRISLQNHGDPVRFRNIWVRPLPEVKHHGDASHAAAHEADAAKAAGEEKAKKSEEK